MRDQLKALVKLSEIDDSARELERELADIPRHLSDLQGDLERLEGMLEQERRELADAEQLRDSQKEQIATSHEGLSRAKIKGAKARNAREVEAAEREMEAVRRSIREREEESKQLTAAIDATRDSLAGRELKIEEFRKIFEEEEAKGKVRVEELQAERAKITKGRDEVVAKVGRAAVNRYERIRTKHPNAVVEVIDTICQGCRLNILPQQFNNMHTASSIEQCPHCLRLIYLRQSIED